MFKRCVCLFSFLFCLICVGGQVVPDSLSNSWKRIEVWLPRVDTMLSIFEGVVELHGDKILVPRDTTVKMYEGGVFIGAVSTELDGSGAITYLVPNPDSIYIDHMWDSLGNTFWYRESALDGSPKLDIEYLNRKLAFEWLACYTNDTLGCDPGYLKVFDLNGNLEMEFERCNYFLTYWDVAITRPLLMDSSHLEIGPGYFKRYYPDGQLAVSGQYAAKDPFDEKFDLYSLSQYECDKHNRWIYYLGDGTISSVEVYDRGKLVGKE